MKSFQKKIAIVSVIVCLLAMGTYIFASSNSVHITKQNAKPMLLQSGGGNGVLFTEEIKDETQNLPTQSIRNEFSETLETIQEYNDAVKVSALPTTYSAETRATGKLIYLSDIPHMSKSTTKYGTILNDITSSNTKITVKIGGTATSFDKGIWAHATSDVYYDLRNFQEYDYFSAYLGLNTTSNGGNGVTFVISTSNDGQNWTEKYRAEALPNQNAIECRIPIEGNRYLRLYANDNGANGKDHSVYADAKLLTADYSDGTGVPTVFDLEAQIRNMDENDPNLEHMVLQREFVSRVGRTTLLDFVNQGDSSRETLGWLMGDSDTLGLYFYGSTPIGGYKNSLNVLTKLYQTYKNDLNDDTVKNGVRNGDLFKKMIMAISHTHSTLVRSFLPNVEEDGVTNSNRNDPNSSHVSDPVRRYAVYKKMYLANKLSAVFPKLEVEEMKVVVRALISDNEIEWFRDYITSRGPYTHAWLSYNAKFRYFEDKYYSEENKTMWNNKFHFLEYGIPYQKYLVPQWIVYAAGTQCVGFGDTSANAYSSTGIPAFPVHQPGHIAYGVAHYNSNGDASWQLYNSGATWGNSSYGTSTFYNATKNSPTKQAVYSYRGLLGWGQQYSTGCENLSYLAIAQEAVNDYSNYLIAEKYVMLANAYKGDEAKQEEFYRKAINAQNINVDAWYGLVQLYKNSNVYTEEDCLKLIKEFQVIYKVRPLAFYDLFGMIIGKITTPTLNAEAVSLKTATLQWAEVSANSIHRSVAQVLLGKPQSELATFSFDGQYAGQIRLGSMFNENNRSTWEYSIDGGKTWTETDQLYVQLTETELVGVNERDHIRVHIIGTEIRSTIQIDKTLMLSPDMELYENDAEDTFFVYGNRKLDWKYTDDSGGASAWKSYDEVKPNLSGNRKLTVRPSATGTNLPANVHVFTFTDNKYEANETYIKVKNLSVVDSTPSGKNTPAKNAIDGNFGLWETQQYTHDFTRWLSASKTDENKFITLEFKEPVYLSRLDYIPSDEQNHSGLGSKPFLGRIMQGEVLGSMDGENWTKLGDINNWANNASTKTLRFAETQKVKYIKIIATQTNDGYIGARGFNFYEDTTKEAPPTATVMYSTTQKTNKEVVATLENFNSDTVVVENGITSYTFTENGSYTFNLRDTENGRTNEVVASVTWIDREKPSADIQYIELPNTKGHVQAKVVNISKNVFILDEQDRPIRYIENSGNYIYEFNFDPDTKQIINMVQKDSNNNIKMVRGYKLLDPSKPVSNILEDSTKDIISMGFPESMSAMGYPVDKEYIIAYFAAYSGANITKEIIYDENLKNATVNYTAEELAEFRTRYTTGIQEDILKYVFTKNGEKTYKLRDRIGNTSEIKMSVDWINRGPYIAEISYDKESLTNGDVTATLTFKEEGVRITNLDEGVIETSNGGKYVFTENGDFRFKLLDAENVESYLDAKVTIIDRQVPQGIITYNTTRPTNQYVTATIDFDKTNVTITNNDGKNSYIFTENGSFTFEFVDEAGNVGATTATVDCIDRTTPIAQISYSTTNPTNQDVVANIVDSNKDITITNNNGESIYTFTENGEFTFEFVDEAGNTGTVTAKVDWIDKEEIIPTISYRINSPTGKAETAIITFNKPNVIITNNNGKNTHRFEDNGEFTFEFRDEAGNTGTATATVNWIDKEIPTAELHYDRTIGTKEPVTVTLINPSKDIIITNNGGKNTYTFTKNGKFIFEYEDNAGNPGETMAEVTWIDKDAPIATIEYSTTEDTTEPVVATLHLEDPNMGLLPTTQTYTFTKNGEYIFNFEDSLGNKGTKTAKVNWIYSGNLTADIKYEKTDDGVLATLVNESGKITITNNGGNRTYLLTDENSTFTFEYIDSFGNEGRTEAKLENMNGPATINYSIKTSLTSVNGKPTMIAKMRADLVLPLGYQMKKSTAPKYYIFAEKGTYTFEYINKDTGEEYKATATADWFPEVSAEYSTTELTQNSVDLVIHFNKDGEELQLENNLNIATSKYPETIGYYIEKKEGALNTYTIKHNITITLMFKYQGQRLLSLPVSVTNIDEVEPVGTIKYSNTEPTYRNVTATIEFNKPNVKILNNEGKDTFRFEENGSFTFEYEDEVGRRRTSTANVDWIIEDSDDVVPTILYSEKEPTNKDVIATITFDQDEVRIVDEQGNDIPNGNIYTFTENGTHVFNYIDKKGKAGTATAEVFNIDKEVPIANITYSTTDKTNKPVTASISFNEENVIVEGGDTHTFEDSGSYTFNFMDQAGNRGSAVAEVDWIRKTLPNATITYDETELTCRDVTATISFDLENVDIIDEEGNVIPNGDKYVFTENGTHTFRFRGPYGNEGSAVARVNYIDKVVPVPTITYDVENQTSGNVTATITFDKRNVVVEGGNKHVFTTNGEHTFNFMDEAGNKGWATAKVTWIDSDLPIATITYNPERPDGTSKVNTDVVATISFDQENIKIVNNGGSNQYTFEQNGEYEFAFENANGERGTALAQVSWIDKEIPKATITYSTTNPTNQDVTASITFDKPNVRITNNNGNNTYTFTENNEFEFEFIGPSGNTGKAKATVTWIDKVAPTATITYNPENSTNGDVVATITFNEEDVTITNNDGKNTYTFTENSEFMFEYRDKAGNTGSELAKVTWIDKEDLNATISYNINELTNQDVIASISFNKENVTVEGGNTHIFTENGEYTFEYIDSSGNRGSKLARVDWIDKKIPVGTITYSTTNPTNQNVTASISFDKEDVTITNNGGNNTYIFTENSEFTFEFIDKVGNIGTAKAYVDWIDRKLPVATITYDINTLTNRDVIATITFDKNNVEVEGGNTHTFTENGEYEFAFIGPAGNIGTAIAKVTWIDKKAPVATITYSTTNSTNEDVTATVTFDKEDVIVDGGNVHTFTENGEFTFRYIDSAGNTGTAIAKVTWIDKTLPKATITYSTTNPTNQDVMASISFDKEDVTITNNDGNNTYTFTENGQFEFEFVGPAGNRGTAIAKVNNIDKDVPVPTISYDITNPTNQNVTATITFNEENVTVKDGNTHVFEDSGEYTFEFEDRAGNSGTAIARVDWIKKTLPNATFTYDINTLTNQDVTVTVNFDREGTQVTNNDGKNTYTFTRNGSFTFEFVGPYGNAGVATATVDWIDKEEIIPTITYSTTEMTNQDVTATITFNKEGVTVKGGNIHVFEDSGEYTFEFEDRAGNSGTAIARVDWLKKTLPNATITYNTTNPTNQDVIATITFDIENVIVLGGNTHRFTENGTYLFEFVGPYGNKGTAMAEVYWIDRDEPNATITYSTTNPTNQDVTATVTFDKENVTITNNGGKNTYTFTENGEFEFEFVGPAGNTGIAIATVDWIDKTLPKATITYDKSEPTNQEVTASIAFDKENVTITNNNGKNTYTFTENGQFEFEFVGPAGNAGTAIANVTWIDKEAPVAEIRYSTESATNQEVIATITFNEEDVTVEGGNTHTFTENGEYIFKYSDKAGNQGAKLAKVTWIDKTLPVATISYDINELTNQDVTATVTFDKENVTITNNDGKNTYTFTENGQFEFEFIGPSGNAGVAVASVNWIDKVAPIAEIEYSIDKLTNQDVVATVVNPSEEITFIESDGTHTFTENGEYVFEFIDSAGNRGTVKAEVLWIDKIVPVATITYSTENETMDPVTATITFDKENVKIINNEENNTYLFTENGEFTFEFIDLAGNTGTAIANVNWIQNDLPQEPSFELKLTPSKNTLNVGEEFEIGIAIDNLKNIEYGLVSICGQFEYDESILEILEIKGQNSWNMDENSFNDNNFKFVTEKGEYVSQKENIITMKLKVKDTVEGPLDIKFKVISVIASNSENDIDSDNVEINLHINDGIIEDGTITSDNYNIEEDIISRISPQTTVATFKGNVTANKEITIIDEEGNTLNDDGILATGMKLKLDENIEYTLVITGDINKDGRISITDLAKLKLHIIEKDVLQDCRYLAADINGDDRVSITDLAKLKKLIIGIE